MTISYRQALADTMQTMLAEHPKSVMYGLGVTDPIGIFGTTKGLHETFGRERVFDTPICEETMLGFALGLSLQGYFPINIHIRNDFLLLGMSQLVNSIAKYRSMYGGLYRSRMLVRAVIGRSWGQGAQHSQSLQALFAHIPGLTVIMPSSAESVSSSYLEAIQSYPGPVISLEHRFLYDYEFAKPATPKRIGVQGSRLLETGNDLTIVACSYMVQEFQKLLPILKNQYGVNAELIDIHSISHPNRQMILDSIRKTRKLVVADTSWAAFGLGAEIARWIASTDPILLKLPMKSLSLAPTPCPTAQTLEKFFYPSLEDALRACLELHYSGAKIPALPEPETLLPLIKQFKGPF